MTVKDLKKLLENYPDDLDIFYTEKYGEYDNLQELISVLDLVHIFEKEHTNIVLVLTKKSKIKLT